MITHDQILFRLVLAAILGSVVGFDRERLGGVAGLRTHILVCLGATLFMIVSAFGFNDALTRANVILDPSRVAAGVVSGIGFLGAGTIILRRDMIFGLTTAASLWAVAAVGLAVGGGLYLAGVAATVLIAVVLAGVKPIERRFFQRRRHLALKMFIRRDVTLSDVASAIEAAHIRVKHIIVERSDSAHEHRVEVVLSQTHQKDLLPLIETLCELPGVREVSYLG